LNGAQRSWIRLALCACQCGEPLYSLEYSDGDGHGYLPEWTPGPEGTPVDGWIEEFVVAATSNQLVEGETD
jgi:hypothetical protein